MKTKSGGVCQEQESWSFCCWFCFKFLHLMFPFSIADTYTSFEWLFARMLSDTSWKTKLLWHAWMHEWNDQMHKNRGVPSSKTIKKMGVNQKCVIVSRLVIAFPFVHEGFIQTNSFTFLCNAEFDLNRHSIDQFKLERFFCILYKNIASESFQEIPLSRGIKTTSTITIADCT